MRAPAEEAAGAKSLQQGRPSTQVAMPTAMLTAIFVPAVAEIGHTACAPDPMRLPHRHPDDLFPDDCGPRQEDDAMDAGHPIAAHIDVMLPGRRRIDRLAENPAGPIRHHRKTPTPNDVDRLKP